MNKLAEIISGLSTEELKLIKKDLDEGNIHRIVHRKLNKEENKAFICPVCGLEVDKKTGFVLEFGKEIRRRAIFDELDCLNYFLSRMK